MALIPETVIDDIQARADIAEVIGRYVPLKRAGRHFKALCPFHQERTPSFMVNTEKQIFHCFGCGAGGNIFGFLMQHDRLTFPEAVRQLADHVGVHVPDEREDAGREPRERLRALMEKACRYYERTLQAPAGQSARTYLQSRGVSEPARLRIRVGLAPGGWRGLTEAATASGVSTEELEAAGLVIRGRSKPYDRFRSRLMFPIIDLRGRVVAFGGRSLDAQEPKYLNSPETPLYSKGRQVFGLWQAKEAILKTKTAVVVEGYFDCVVLADAGIANVVSPLGTALTAEQARLLKRYADQVVLAFDADAAGEQATLRGVDLAVEEGLDVRVAQVPRGRDPDEVVRSGGPEAFQQLVDRSVGIIEFLIETARKRYPGSDAAAQAKAAQVILPTIAKVSNAILRREYVKLVAQRLALDEAAVLQELAKVAARPAVTTHEPSGRPSASGTSTTLGAERLLVGLVLEDPSRAERVRDQVSAEAITDPALRGIFATVCARQAAGQGASVSQIISRLTEEGYGSVIAGLVELAQSVTAREAALDDCVKRVRANSRRRELATLRERIRVTQDAGEDREVQRLLAEYHEHVKGG